MAHQTSIKRSFLYWNLVYFIICAGFGVWGAYDYWVTIPERYKAVARYTALTEEQDKLETRADFFEIQTKLRQGTATDEDKATLEKIRKDGTGVPKPLTDADRARYEEINKVLTDEFENTPPQAPASYDGWVNFYVYFIGCGILGAPWFLWKLVSRRSLSWRLEEDGTLVTPDGTYTHDQIKDINMAKWMKKSIAKVHVQGADDQEEEVTLDDYEHQHTHLIVGALAHRFYPEEWTEEAKPVKRDSDSGAEEKKDEDEDASVEAEASTEEDATSSGSEADSKKDD